jgi:hypothetical protein
MSRERPDRTVIELLMDVHGGPFLRLAPGCLSPPSSSANVAWCFARQTGPMTDPVGLTKRLSSISIDQPIGPRRLVPTTIRKSPLSRSRSDWRYQR